MRSNDVMAIQQLIKACRVVIGWAATPATFSLFVAEAWWDIAVLKDKIAYWCAQKL